MIYLLLIFSPFFLVLPLTLYFLRFSQAPQKGKAEDEIIFQDSFDEGSLEWDYFHHGPGNWEWLAAGGVAGGVFHHVYPSSGTWGHDDFAYLKEKNYSDFSVESAVKILAGYAGIQGRVVISNLGSALPTLGGYRCELAGGGKIKIQRYLLIQEDGQEGDHRNPLDLKVADFSWQTGQWYNLKMELVGNHIRCLVDGDLKVEYTDTNSLTDYEKSQGKVQNGAVFKNGTVGFITYAANAYWDNVLVKNLAGGPSPTLGPTATPPVGCGINCEIQSCPSPFIPKNYTGLGCECVRDCGKGDFATVHMNNCSCPEATATPGGPTNTPAPTLTPAATPTLTLTPTPVVSQASINFKVAFQGFNSAERPDFLVTLKIKGTDYEKEIPYPAGAEAVTASLTNSDFVKGRNYDLLLSSWGFLTLKVSGDIYPGCNPANGYFDFGTFKAGDLNGDNQINGLDWSLMKSHYGETGDE